jgi:hypothetical protein
VADVCKDYGDKDLGNAMMEELEQLLHAVSGTAYDIEHVEDSLSIAD